MNPKHRKTVEAEGMRHYDHRRYMQSRIDQRMFDALNVGDLCHVAVDGYCLDALDIIPCGGMYQAARMPTQIGMPRGWTLAEKQRCDVIATRIVAEILAEIAAEENKP